MQTALLRIERGIGATLASPPPPAATVQCQSETSLRRPVVARNANLVPPDRARRCRGPGVATGPGVPPLPAPARWPNFRPAAPAATTPVAAPALPRADQCDPA